MKNPETDDDYIKLMRLMTKLNASLMSSERFRENAMEFYFKRHYLNPEENREETRAEFFKLAKLCLERKKFMAIRSLDELYHKLCIDEH